MKRIPLTQGKFALVSNQDYTRLSQWKWFAHKNYKTFYAQRASKRVAGKQGLIHMHQVVFGGPCDHKNRNGLDNRRCNLRAATKSQQMRNRGKFKTSTSPFKGITRGGKKWVAAIFVGRKRIYLGRFNYPENAAKAYDEAALEYFGEFAVLNFPERTA